MKTWIAGIALAWAAVAHAQPTPVGLWKTIDDKSGKERSYVRISDGPNGLSGRIEKRLDPDAKPDDVCDKCPDDRKGQRVQGLEIIRGGKKVDGEPHWEGGNILDPEAGKTYRLRLTPQDGGQKLEVRGYIGPFFRNQHWIRVE